MGCCIIGVLAGLVATGRLRSGDGMQALTNVVVQVACGIGAVYAGFMLVERFGVAGR